MIFVAGRSGVGKDSLVNEVSKRLNLKILKSYTDRPKRYAEEDTHIFIDKNSKVDNIAAQTVINGYRYFSTWDQIKENDIYIIDLIGLEAIRGDKDTVVYIEVPEKERRRRALQRGDDESVFESRSKSEDEQFCKIENGLYDYKIVNLDFEEAVEELCEICRKELRL